MLEEGITQLPEARWKREYGREVRWGEVSQGCVNEMYIEAAELTRRWHALVLSAIAGQENHGRHAADMYNTQVTGCDHTTLNFTAFHCIMPAC